MFLQMLDCNAYLLYAHVIDKFYRGILWCSLAHYKYHGILMWYLFSIIPYRQAKIQFSRPGNLESRHNMNIHSIYFVNACYIYILLWMIHAEVWTVFFIKKYYLWSLQDIALVLNKTLFTNICEQINSFESVLLNESVEPIHKLVKMIN